MAIKIAFLFVFFFGSSAFYGQNADIDLLRSLNRGDMPQWDRGMKALSASVYPISIVAPIGIWTQGYLTKDKEMTRNGYKSAITIGLAMILSTGIKDLVKRERPFLKYPKDIVARDKAGSWSFPSGHTTAAFATATSLCLTYREWYVTLPAYAYAGFVGYSRMRLGLHYPSDVLGGVLLGIGSGWLTWKLDKLLFKR